MRVHHRLFYLPTSGQIEGERSQKWWDAWNLTAAVKDGTLKGFVNIKVCGEVIRIDKSNAEKVRKIFGKWIVSTAEKEVGRDFAVVPVPSTDAVDGTCGPFRSTKCLEVALDGLSVPILDVLRFTEKLKRASQGGPRFADEIYPKLKVTKTAACEVPLVLVDDVMTSGGHMKASRARLTEAGFKVVCGIVWGRTVYSTNFDPFAAGVIEISDSIKPYDTIDF